MVNYIFVLWLAFVVNCAPTRDDYLKRRAAFIMEDLASRTGSQVVLDPTEQKVNAFLMHLKEKEFRFREVTKRRLPTKDAFLSCQKIC